MNGKDRAAAKAAEAEEAAQRAPGMGSALLAVLVMILSTLLLAALIYVVMATAIPTEREPRKAADIEQPVTPAESAKRIQN